MGATRNSTTGAGCGAAIFGRVVFTPAPWDRSTSGERLPMSNAIRCVPAWRHGRKTMFGPAHGHTSAGPIPMELWTWRVGSDAGRRIGKLPWAPAARRTKSRSFAVAPMPAARSGMRPSSTRCASKAEDSGVPGVRRRNLPLTNRQSPTSASSSSLTENP